MNCPLCGKKTRVLDSRITGDLCRRRRECTACKERFSTQERQVLEAADAGSVGDAIRAMTDEQLSHAIGEQATNCICDLVCPDGCQAKTKNECKRAVLSWLRGEVDGLGG